MRRPFDEHNLLSGRLIGAPRCILATGVPFFLVAFTQNRFVVGVDGIKTGDFPASIAVASSCQLGESPSPMYTAQLCSQDIQLT